MAVPHKHVFTAGEHKPRGNRWVAEVWKELKARSRKTACAEKGIGAVPAIYVEDDWRGISVKTWSDRALYGKRPSNGSKPSRSINKIGRESILERIPAPEFASTLLVRGVLLSMFGSDQTLAYKILKKKINVLAESHVDYVWPISYAIMRHPEL